MKYLLLIFLLLTKITWSEERGLQSDEGRIFTGFQQFKVLTSLPHFAKIDQQLIYDAMANSFKKHGQVTVTERYSIFQYLFQLNHQDTLLCIAIDKNGEQITGSIEILAEVEILKNKHKTACPIWKRNFSATIPKDQENQIDLTIANLIDEMIDNFSKILTKSNTESKELVFQIQKCQDL